MVAGVEKEDRKKKDGERQGKLGMRHCEVDSVGSRDCALRLTLTIDMGGILVEHCEGTVNGCGNRRRER